MHVYKKMSLMPTEFRKTCGSEEVCEKVSSQFRVLYLHVHHQLPELANSCVLSP